MFWPAIEEAIQQSIEGDYGEAVTGSFTKAFSGMKKLGTGSLPPFVEIAMNIGAMMQGNNPEDFWRQKPILPDDIAKGGSPLDKAWEYAKYRGASYIPGMTYDRFKINSKEEAQGIIEEALSNYGPISNILKIGVRASNYGMWESLKEGQQELEKFNAQVKLLLPEKVRLALNEASRVSSFELLQPKDPVTGKKARQALPTEEERRYKRIAVWKNRYYKKYLNEIKRAYEAVDMEAFDRYAKRLVGTVNKMNLFSPNSEAGREEEED